MKLILHSVEIVLILLGLIALFTRPRPKPTIPEREVNKWGAIEL